MASDLAEFFHLQATFTAGTVEHDIPGRDNRKEKWKDISSIGRGAFGHVILQEETSNGKKRAVKTLPKHEATDPKYFFQELNAIAMLSKYDDLFAQFLGWYEDEHSYFLAMEYFELGDLAKCVKDMPGHVLPEVIVQSIAVQVLQGLSRMHTLGFTHRDLKPQNIFVLSRNAREWCVRIGDFGVSKRLGRGPTTVLHTRAGTEHYMAPEVLLVDHDESDDESDSQEENEGRREKAYSNAVDMWSLGCTLYELLTGQPPFKKTKHLLKFARHRAELPKDPLAKHEVGDDCTAFLEALLSLSPEDRPSTTVAQKLPWCSEAINANPTDVAESIQPYLDGSESSGNSPSRTMPRTESHALSTTHPEAVVTTIPSRNPEKAAASVTLQELIPGIHSTMLEEKPRPGVPEDQLRENAASLRQAFHHINTSTTELQEHGGKLMVHSPISAPNESGRKLKESSSGQDPIITLHSPTNGKQHVTLEQRPEPSVPITQLESAAEVAVQNDRTIRPLKSERNSIAKSAVSPRLLAPSPTNSDEVKPTSSSKSKRNTIFSQFPNIWSARKLTNAAEEGHLTKVQDLLKHGADIEVKDTNGNTPLHRLARNGHKEIVAELLEHGADINAKNKDGCTPLDFAACNGHKEIVSELLKHGADIEANDTNGNTPLHLAAGEGHKEIVSELLRCGVDINAQNTNNWSPLHFAAWYGHKEMVSELLKHGADINLITKDGDTALAKALKYKKTETANLLREHGALTTGKVHIGGRRKSIEMSEVEAVAAARMQPTLDEIAATAQKRRERDSLTLENVLIAFRRTQEEVHRRRAEAEREKGIQSQKY